MDRRPACSDGLHSSFALAHGGVCVGSCGFYVGSCALIGSIVAWSKSARTPTVALQTTSPAGESLVTADRFEPRKPQERGCPYLPGEAHETSPPTSRAWRGNRPKPRLPHGS